MIFLELWETGSKLTRRGLVGVGSFLPFVGNFEVSTFLEVINTLEDTKKYGAKTNRCSLRDKKLRLYESGWGVR